MKTITDPIEPSYHNEYRTSHDYLPLEKIKLYRSKLFNESIINCNVTLSRGDLLCVKAAPKHDVLERQFVEGILSRTPKESQILKLNHS